MLELHVEDGFPRQLLEDVLEPEMAKQYRLRRGEQCVYMPVFSGDRYLCSCGAVGSAGENCPACGLEPEALDRTVMEELRLDAEVRLEQEAQEAARLEQERLAQEAEERKQQQKRRKKAILRGILGLCALVCLLVLAAGVFWAVTRIAIPASHYNQALEALEKGNYQEAHRQFTLAGDYKDAEEYLSRFRTPCLTTHSVSNPSPSTEVYYSSVVEMEERTTEHWIEYTYDDFGRLLKKTEKTATEDDQGNLSEPVETVHETILYNENGDPLETVNWYGRTVYTYNEHGDVQTRDSYYSDGTQRESFFYNYVYDDAGRVLKFTEICTDLIIASNSYEQTYEYTYDENGRVLTQTTTSNYPAFVDSNYTSTTTWTYNKKGDPVRCETVTLTPNSPENNSNVCEDWVYDEEGRQTSYVKTFVYPSNSRSCHTYSTTTVYNKRGDLVEQVTKRRYPNDPSRDFTSTTTCTYNWEGKLTRQVDTCEYANEEMNTYGGYTSTTEYTYDLFGRLTTYVMTIETGESSHVETTAYTYTDGVLTGSTSTRNGTSDGTTGSSSTTRCTYNENGLIQTSKTDGSLTEYTYAYFYYPEGTEPPADTIDASGVFSFSSYLYGYKS